MLLTTVGDEFVWPNSTAIEATRNVGDNKREFYKMH